MNDQLPLDFPLTLGLNSPSGGTGDRDHASIALVEDDERLAGLAIELVKAQGWHVAPFRRATDFLAACAGQDFDAILLDQRLPDASGLEILEQLTARQTEDSPMPPVMMVTSCADDQMLEAAFEAGARDFVLKPYRARELVARLRAMMRRSRAASVGARPESARLQAGWPSLTQRERRCAEILLARLGQTVSRDQLRQQVWGLCQAVQTRTIDTHVSRVRTKLGLTPDHGFSLITLYGVGWRLERRDFS